MRSRLSRPTLAACTDPAAPGGLADPGRASLSRGGSGGGAVTPGPLTSPLPTTLPAPDIPLRESFGLNDGARPGSGSGAPRSTSGAEVSLKRVWLEFPGSEDTQWLASDTGQRWTLGGGVVIALSPTLPTACPTAPMPITVARPSGGYEYSMEGWSETTPGAYLAIGVTNSSALASNLTSGGSLRLRVTDPTGRGLPLHYELRTGSHATGQLLLEGDGGMRGFNPMALRVSPAAGTVRLNFGMVAHTGVFDYADTTSVTVPATIPQARSLKFAGIGVPDDLVLRR